MALLALLALPVATVATVASGVRVEPLHRVPAALDDRYRGCGDAVTILENRSDAELRHKQNLARLWDRATAEWCRRRSRDPSREPSRDPSRDPSREPSPLSPSQAIALLALTMEEPSAGFHVATHHAGISSREYRDGFHSKALHFLLSEALRRLWDPWRCHRGFRGFGDVWLDARPGLTVRFGQFMVTSLSAKVAQGQGNVTLLQVKTCHGAIIQNFSYNPGEQQLLVSPFETFQVTKVTRDGNTTRIHLKSTRTFSKYNCEWL